MVVFTCNNCGESLQKPKVEKHYLTVCRRAAKSLTCVDCFKDFLSEDYTAHTKCVTEEERYAAKGTFPNGVVKKGEVKQQSWTEVIQFVVENTPTTGSGQNEILALLSSANNVPRKKNKFINFVKNALNRRVTISDIDSIWNIIEKHKTQQVVSETVEEGAKSKNGNQEHVDESATGILHTVEKSKSFDNENEVEKTKNNKETVVNATSVENSKHKKKKCNRAKENECETIKNENKVNMKVIGNGTLNNKQRKKSKNVEEQNEITNGIEEETNVEITVPILNKSAKNDKKISRNTEEIAENENIKETPYKNETEKKKKKKSRSSDQKDHYVAEHITLEAASETIENSGEPLKKKKKSADKSQTDKAVDDQTPKHIENSTGVVVDIIEENSKVKKRKLEDYVAKISKENGIPEQKKIKCQSLNNELNLLKAPTENQSLGTSSGFSFKETIAEIVKAKNSISLKKLQKKVLEAYEKFTGIDPSEKEIKKFNKHLKKVSGIEVLENNVRCTSN